MNLPKIVAGIVLVVTGAFGAAAEDAPVTEAAEHLDLLGVADLFKQSASVEDFETKLNEQVNEVNNLDLNSDNQVDYIGVVEQVDGNVHVLILRVPLAEDEFQDVASVELEKKSSDEVTVQVVGDEELYGANYIVEVADTKTSTWEKLGDSAFEMASAARSRAFPTVSLSANPPVLFMTTGGVVVVRVTAWPVLRVVFAPGYRPWRTPYRWGHHPRWWRPWRPVTISVYRGRTARWAHRGFHRTKVGRSPHGRNIYQKHRKASGLSKHKKATVSPGKPGAVHKPPASQPGKKTGPKKRGPGPRKTPKPKKR